LNCFERLILLNFFGGFTGYPLYSSPPCRRLWGAAAIRAATCLQGDPAKKKKRLVERLYYISRE
jgi:hypothetical protein